MGAPGTAAPTPSDDRLWYVAYGSNLSAVRLQRYLDAAPDPSPPLTSRPVVLPHRLFFAYESRRWTGGSAFVDPRRDPGAGTRATAWLLTRTQFRWVLAHENGRTEPHDAGAADVLGPGERRHVDDRRYGLVLGCDSPDDHPALTFTTPATPLPEPTRPSAAYVDTIVSGLVDGHDLDDAGARAYLAERIR